MDYRQFLDKRDELVLPYFGGTRVEAKTRRFRIVGDWLPGWWKFAIKKREARPSGPAEPPSIEHLPAVRGHYVGGWLFSSGSEVHRIALPLENEPEPFAPCVGRRWFSGDILMDAVEFEDEAEESVRLALESDESIANTKGVSPGLRAAFGFAVATKVAEEFGVHLSVREVGRHVLDIANGGADAARNQIERIERERERQRIANEERLREHALRRAAREVRVVASSVDPISRADRALENAGARMLRARRVSGNLEVVFTFMGERFISLVDRDTLRVIDSGICLSGADRELNLKSLPSAIREAINGDLLHITRH